MLKKNLLYILCMASIAATHLNHTTSLPAKVLQLYQLQEIVQTVNRIKPTGNYLLAVPPFIELTTQDIQHFLAAIPSGIIEQRGRKKHPLSTLDFIKNAWNKVVEQARTHKTITPLMRENLIEIRAAIETAFRHDLLSGPTHPSVKTFLERQREQNNILIASAAPEIPLFKTKSAYPLTTHSVNAGITRVLNSYFSEQTVQEHINQGSLNPNLDLHVILQSMIMEDEEAKQLVVSGVSCSYDALSNIPHIITIRSAFGDAKAVGNIDMATDTYYVHDGAVYPIIRKKTNRSIPDHHIMRSRLMPNAEQLHNAPTLNIQAVQEIARATKLIEEIYNEPVCVTFIKRDNTIYLIKVHTSDLSAPTGPSYFDPLYTETVAQEKKVTIMPVKPSHSLVVVKKREKIILAPNVRTFVSMLNKRTKPENVAIGIIKKMPAAQSKEAQLLDTVNIPVVWSPAFEQLRSWIDERTFPLVFDIQQKVAFPFSRCRGFCTLFQAVQSGIRTHPLEPHLSVLPEFMFTLNPGERETLKPDEHFSGVTLTHLFDLLKFGSYATAESALSTVLFRLQKQILHEHITKKECAVSLQPFDSNKCERMELFYGYVERVAYQLHAQLKRLYGAKTTPADTLEKIFLVNILQTVIMQQPDEQIIGTESFMHLTNKA